MQRFLAQALELLQLLPRRFVGRSHGAAD
jgi:hypothetical protein